MGKIYPEISVERGLTAALRRASARRGKRKGERPREDPTTISVRDMKMGDVAGGTFYVRSSNLEAVVLSAGWSQGARARLETRRRDGNGEAKGRILYGILETLNSSPMTIAALCYHYERAGEVVIRSIDATTDLTDHRAKIFAALTTVAERVALETSGGRRGRLLYEMPRDQTARWFRENLGFRDGGRPQKNRVTLCRDAPIRSSRRLRAR